jgi:hypothetical protein
VEWVSGGSGERVNIALYLDGSRLQSINVNNEGLIQPLDADAENYLWFITTDFDPSDKYSLRIEVNGQSKYQDSDIFSLIGKKTQSQSQSSLFNGTMIFILFFSFVVLCSVFALPFCGGITVSKSFRVWGLCVVAEVVDLVILLIGWLMFADTATASCDTMMLTAVLIQAFQVILVFAMVMKLGLLEKKEITFVRNFCLAMDVVQTVLYSISEGTCGDGIIISIVVGVGLLLVFLTEYAHIGKLDSTKSTTTYTGANIQMP